MLNFHTVNESFMWGVTILLKRINLGFFLEIKALMVNLIHENKNFLKGSFSRNSQLRPKEKIYKNNGSPSSKGNPNKRKKKNKGPSSQNPQTQIFFYIIVG